jgi:hypothetical protein
LQVAADRRGFTVVWETYGFHLEEPAPTNVLASLRRFDRDGGALHRQIDLAPIGRTYRRPGLEVLPDGRSLVAWTRSPGRTSPDIFARWVEPDGAPLGSRFRLIGSRSEATSAWVLGMRALQSAGFAVAWTDRVVGPPEDHRLHLRCLSPSGETLGHRTLSSGGTAPPAPPALIALGEGFLAVWGEPGRGPSPVQIVAQTYDSTCRPVRPLQHLCPAATTRLDAAMDAAGNLLVSTLAVVGEEYRTVGYVFDRQLRRVGGELDLAPGYVARGATAAVEGGFVVAWTGKTSWPPGNLMGTFVPSPSRRKRRTRRRPSGLRPPRSPSRNSWTTK